MNARTSSLVLPAFGEYLEGGFFHGAYILDGQLWGEVTAAKALEIANPIWHDKYTDVKGATSDFDGLANTEAMAKAGSKLAKEVLALEHNGFTGYFVPARGGALMQWANLAKLLSKAEAFAKDVHRTSTQYSRDDAYGQGFDSGDAYVSYKDWQGGVARPVRRFLIG